MTLYFDMLTVLNIISGILIMLALGTNHGPNIPSIPRLFLGMLGAGMFIQGALNLQRRYGIEWIETDLPLWSLKDIGAGGMVVSLSIWAAMHWKNENKGVR